MQKIKHYRNIVKIIFKAVFIRNNPIFVYLYKYKAQHFYKKKSISEYRFQYPQKNQLALFSIAYNDHTLLELQYEHIKKFLKDNFCYTIIDNSNKLDEAKLVEKYCISNNINYVKLPKNPCFYSESHASALNYCYQNYIQHNENIENFWFLDHDIMPYTECSILDHIKEWIYGLKISWGIRWGRWFLWSWFCFFNKQWKNLDFWISKTYFPLSILDTWWSNRYHIYQYINNTSHLEQQDERHDNVDNKTYHYRLVWKWLHFWWWNIDLDKQNYLNKTYFHINEYKGWISQ